MTDATVHMVPRRHAVHQFHPGAAYGDAITNSMLLTQRVLRGLGYRSEIFVQYPDDRLDDTMFLIDDLPEHDDYVLIVLHSLGHEQAARIAALPAAKILMYHNITPAHLLSCMPGLARYADLGREQLDFWRDRTVAALAVSEFNALELRRHGYRSVGVCPLLFDIDELRARVKRGGARDPGQPFTILFVGRIVESKSQIDLVTAFAAFRARYGKPCRLVLVGRSEGGSDAYVAALYRRIGDLGLRGVVTVTGQVSDAELIGWFDQADLYVSLSRHEGFGVPLIEAMAHGVPVIAYATGAVPYTMGGAGKLLNDAAPDVAAAAMLEFAGDPALRTATIARQRDNLDRFRLARHIPVLIEAVNQAGAVPIDPRADRDSLAQHLNFVVAGHVNGSYSLAEVNRTLAAALADAAPGRVRLVPVEQVPTDDLSGVPAADVARMQALRDAALPPTGPVVVISQHYPLHVPAASPDRPVDLAIALFFWEESLIPAPVVATLNRSFDAVFAPSRFVAKALIDSGVSVPVRVVGYAPRLDRFAALADDRSACTTETFTFLHVSSAFPRKGIDLLLAAFAEAFAEAAPGPCRPRLVIKCFPNPHNEVAAQIAILRESHPNLPEIVLIDRDITEAELLDLYRSADAMVLPSRGEGFNLPAAEAIAAGLRLVVTGAGGHMDFITEQEADLLPWQIEPSRSHLATGSSLWLAPDQAALTRTLVALITDPGRHEDAVVQQQAVERRDAVLRRLDPASWTRRIATATVDLLLRPKSPRRFGWISSWDVRCGVADYTRSLLTAVTGAVGDDDQMIVVTDHRVHPRTELIGRQRVAIMPAWTLGDVETTAGLAAGVSRADPDVLMIEHQPGLILWAGLARLLNDPRVAARVVVVTLHSTRHLFEQPATEQRLVLDALRSAARIVVHTIADVNLLAAQGLSETVVMIPHGAPMPRDPRPARTLDPATDAPVIGCYGFLLPAKGITRLIAALPALLVTWTRARLRLVNALYGSEDSENELAEGRRLAEHLGVAHAIEWITDFLPHEASLDHLAGCDLIVLPYRPTLEASSAALRNCLASRTPTLVTPFPIFDEAGDAVARLASDTPDAIATGIADLLADPTARATLSANAARWLAERGWDAIGQRTFGMLAGLFGAAGPGAAADQLHVDAIAPEPNLAVPAPRAGGRAADVARDPWLEPHSPLATRADIIACFRILLGRSPNLEEWRGHALHIGDNLNGVVSSYLNSLEFSRRGLLQQEISSETVISECDGFRIFSDLADDAVGKVVRETIYEPEVAAIFRRTLRPGMGVLDIGANIGYFSMMSAVLVGATGHVFAVEPNPQNAKLLEASRRLNKFDQVTVFNVAAGSHTGVLSLHTSHSTGTTSDLPDDIGALLVSRIVPCVALDSIIPSDRRIDLIKIDVDGGEYTAMRGCEALIRRDRPAIITEFVPGMIRGISGVSGEDYLRWIGAQGYTVAVIEPDGALTPMGQDWAAVMAAYTRRGIDHIDLFAQPTERA